MDKEAARLHNASTYYGMIIRSKKNNTIRSSTVAYNGG